MHSSKHLQNSKHQKAVSRLSVLLEHINMQAQKSDQQNSQNKSHKLIENNDLFSPHLFSSQSDQISVYVKEVKTKLENFSRLISVGNDNSTKQDLAKSALEQIEQQISALMNALQANKSMHDGAQASIDAKKHIRNKSIKAAQQRQAEKYKKMAKSVVLTSHQLYQQLNEHHEFERRLMDMVTEREQQRVRSKSANNEKLSQEVLVLHQRLGRCRKAISTIERNIEIAEKNNR